MVHKHTVLAAGWLTCAVGAVFAMSGDARSAPQVREVSVRADQYAFAPSRIDVQKDEIVKVTFTAVDIPHSFTIDGYRISKRAAAGQTVTFEFRADRTGPFPFYCNLTKDDRCKQMHGELSVK
ncbi:MAG: cupredoxin domain-containing protein [Acidobacteria bacterium]|nr:cupredoxin domain-containing protein [Acidobacteriota bacterium]